MIAIVRRPGGDGDPSAVCRRGVARVVPPCPAGVPSPARRRGTVTCRARSRPGPRHAHRRRSHGGGRDAALLARRRRARRAVRRGRAPALPRGRQRAGRAAADGCHRTSTSPPTRAPSRSRRWCPDGRRPCGTPASPSAPSGAVRRGVTCEITTFRADAYDGVSRNPVVAFGDSVEDDLVRRDFTVNAMARVAARPHLRRPVRRARRPGPRRPRHPDRPGGRRSATTRCGCCARPASSPSSGSRSRRGCAWRWTAMARPARTDHRGAGAGRALEAAARRAPPARDRAAWSTPGSPTSCCPRCRRCAWRSTSTPSTRTSTSTR